MEPLFDVIIPVSYKDCKILKKNIPWIRKYLSSTGNIFILVNDSCFKDFPKQFCQNYRVTLIDENRLLDDLSFNKVRTFLAKHQMANMTGWYFQQFLKIGFSISQYASNYYLIWDADTFPLRKISFWDENKILYNPKREHHQPYFKTISKLLGITNFANYSFISEHMMVKTGIMKEMINKISPEEKNWVEKILESCDLSNRQAFSEFETYGNYCMNYHPNLMKERQLLTLRCGGKLFGRQVTERELQMLSLDFDTASFERGQYPPFPRSVYSKFDRLMIELRHRYVK